MVQSSSPNSNSKQVAGLVYVAALASLVAIMTTTTAPWLCAAAQTESEDYVKAHNEARKAVNVGPVSWNSTVAEVAQNYAADFLQPFCEVDYSENENYGENIARGEENMSAADAVKQWVEEMPFYDHGSNSCAAGHVCSHYTQVVWRDSTSIGCSRVVCARGRSPVSFIVCNYYPRGNIPGKAPY